MDPNPTREDTPVSLFPFSFCQMRIQQEGNHPLAKENAFARTQHFWQHYLHILFKYSVWYSVTMTHVE